MGWKKKLIFLALLGDLGVGERKEGIGHGHVHLQMTEYTGFCQKHYTHFYNRSH